ncbi:MAG: enoyl-CoA hydratase/isomerase family protein [Chloroflexota bacterium]|nr:MAG: enoyl-CoA hydratase/isomerase family protein [Chloroflexota bacterium]
MKYQVRKAVVIGAGTMGAAIAAHLANIHVPVTLLDIAPTKLNQKEKEQGLTLEDPKVRNRIVQEGFDRALKSRPASFFTAELANLVSVGNLEDDFNVIQDADWVIEAIIENLEIKQQLMERIDKVRGKYTIVSTNTSGIPVASITKGRSQSFREHFLGTHFFNPPRYLKLVEVIPTGDTLSGVVDFISHFLEYRLGKGVVLAKDTPNFIANRLGFAGGAFSLHYILEQGYTVEEVDAITGPVIGRPKTATFRLIDLVGIDVWEHVGKNLITALPHDKEAIRYLESEKPNQLIHNMVEKGWLGNKTKQGFYKQVMVNGKKEFWVLNFGTMDYEAPKKPRFDSIGDAKDEDDLEERLRILLAAEDRAGELVQGLLYQGMAYASDRIPEIADTPKPIDDAMRWGFNQAAGPFEAWDKLGVADTLLRIKERGFKPATWVDEMLENGISSFYQYKDGIKIGVYSPGKGNYLPIERSPMEIKLKQQTQVAKNAGATLWDLGDGVACVEFHTKMNALDEDISKMIHLGIDKLDQDFEGLILSTEADNFSAGANLFMVVMMAQNQDWENLDLAIRGLQNLTQRIRYAPKPVVAAPAGIAMGGGLEILLHASRIVAGAELYTGPVEAAHGLIPAGGGTKELLRRMINPPMKIKDAEPLPFLMQMMEYIVMSYYKVSPSAEEARVIGYLTPCDRVVLNREHLLAEAKKEVLSMVNSGYVPPLPEKIYAAGRDALAAMRVGLYMFKEGNYFSEHDTLVFNKAAYVATGGDISRPSWVEEQYILDLEREAFLSLCGEEKTQERIWHVLRTGKPLRN